MKSKLYPDLIEAGGKLSDALKAAFNKIGNVNDVVISNSSILGIEAHITCKSRYLDIHCSISKRLFLIILGRQGVECGRGEFNDFSEIAKAAYAWSIEQKPISHMKSQFDFIVSTERGEALEANALVEYMNGIDFIKNGVRGWIQRILIFYH